ncbi:MAG: N-acetyltransferase [Ferruginibacter sp.]|nr:N-acetyltransferase [Ferruginibacter sp.]
MDVLKEKFTISTDQSRLNVLYIHQFLERSYWAQNIPLGTVKKSIEGAVCFGVYDGEKQVGFARVITDKATFGHLADVFIDESYRGLGLSKWLVETIMNHPDLQGFRSWQLGTRDAHGLYAKFGFRALENPERMMRKHDPDVYKNKVPGLP